MHEVLCIHSVPQHCPGSCSYGTPSHGDGRELLLPVRWGPQYCAGSQLHACQRWVLRNGSISCCLPLSLACVLSYLLCSMILVLRLPGSCARAVLVRQNCLARALRAPHKPLPGMPLRSGVNTCNRSADVSCRPVLRPLALCLDLGVLSQGAFELCMTCVP